MASEVDTPPSEQLATASTALGLVSLLTCWWFPFDPLTGAVGTGCGLLAWRGAGASGRPAVGATLSAAGTGAGVLLAWNYWGRLFGL
ncbi:MAG TPA: hypothetical protein VGE74_16435 [Gemmata sp.]